MSWLLLGAWLSGSVGTGLLLARRALPDEQRLSVLLGYALICGLCLQTLLLVLMWGYFPLGAALWTVLASSLVITIAWLTRLVRNNSLPTVVGWGMTAADTMVLTFMLVGFAFIGFRTFTSAYTAWDAEALYWHSSLVGWIGKAPFPPTSPLEPNDLVHYRFGFHSLPAAIASISGQLPPEVLAATVAMTTPLILVSLAGSSIRVFGSPRPGFIAALVGLLGGSFLPIYRLFQGLLGRPVETERAHEMLGGLLSAGNTLDMLHNNVSVAMGFVYATMALWACWEFARQREPIASTATCALAVVATLGLVNEVYFAAIAPAFVAVTGLRAIMALREGHCGWWRAPAISLVIVALALVVVSLRGGFLGGIQLADDAPNSVRLAINTEQFGFVPAPPGVWEPKWIPLLSPDPMVDTLFIIVVLPLLALNAFRRNDLFPLMSAGASAVVLAAWLTVYPKNATYDGYRFYQAAFSMYLVAGTFFLAPHLADTGPKGSRARRLLGGLLVALVILPHALFATWSVSTPPRAVVATLGAPDYEPTLWLRESTTTSRVLVPLEHGEQNFMELYYSGSQVGTAMRSVLGLSGHVVPIGHGSQYWNPEPYIRPYRKASACFDAESLTELKIDWIYLIPSLLSPDQLRNLEAAVLRGDLTPSRRFGYQGTAGERALFRVNGNGAGSGDS